MIKNSKLRMAIGALLGACAGMSLAMGILPMVLFKARIGDETTLTYLLSRYLPHTMLLWAMGGWSVTRTRGYLGGSMVLALTGLASGLLLMFAALNPAPKILAVGGVTGLIYGFLGGLLLARVLAAPSANEAEEE